MSLTALILSAATVAPAPAKPAPPPPRPAPVAPAKPAPAKPATPEPAPISSPANPLWWPLFGPKPSQAKCDPEKDKTCKEKT
jgi:hypothetical protein